MPARTASGRLGQAVTTAASSTTVMVKITADVQTAVHVLYRIHTGFNVKPGFPNKWYATIDLGVSLDGASGKSLRTDAAPSGRTPPRTPAH
jgi:hypothetical protein